MLWWPLSSCDAVAALLPRGALLSVSVRHVFWVLMTSLSSCIAMAVLLSCIDGRAPHVTQHLWRFLLSGSLPRPLGVDDSALLSNSCGRAPLTLRWPHSSCATMAALLTCCGEMAHCYGVLLCDCMLCSALDQHPRPSPLGQHPSLVGMRHTLWVLMTALTYRMAMAALLSHCSGRDPLAWHWPCSSHAKWPLSSCVAMAVLLLYSVVQK